MARKDAEQRVMVRQLQEVRLNYWNIRSAKADWGGGQKGQLPPPPPPPPPVQNPGAKISLISRARLKLSLRSINMKLSRYLCHNVKAALLGQSGLILGSGKLFPKSRLLFYSFILKHRTFKCTHYSQIILHNFSDHCDSCIAASLTIAHSLLRIVSVGDLSPSSIDTTPS